MTAGGPIGTPTIRGTLLSILLFPSSNIMRDKRYYTVVPLETIDHELISMNTPSPPEQVALCILPYLNIAHPLCICGDIHLFVDLDPQTALTTTLPPDQTRNVIRISQ